MEARSIPTIMLTRGKHIITRRLRLIRRRRRAAIRTRVTPRFRIPWIDSGLFYGAFLFLLASFVAAFFSAAALILATWTTSSRPPEAVSQTWPGLARHMGQTKLSGLI